MVHRVGILGHVFAQLLEDVQGFDVSGIGEVAFTRIVLGQCFRIHHALADGAQVVGHGPGSGETGGNGFFITGGLQGFAQFIEFGEGGGNGQAQFVEHVLVVEEGFAIHGPRNAVLLAVNVEGRQLAFHKAVLEFRICFQQSVPFLHAAGLDQVGGEAAGPGHEHVGNIVGGYQHANLFFVGVIEHLVGFDLDVRVFRLKFCDQTVQVAELGFVGPAMEETHGDLVGESGSAHGQEHHDSQNQSDFFHGETSFFYHHAIIRR